MAYNDTTSSSGHTQRFHPNHANNVVLEENGQVAYRTTGYGNGFVFSERYLEPGEIFVVEIERNDKQWFQGYLRLGLTQVNPADYSCGESVSRQENFDLRQLGSTWMFRLTELLLNLGDQTECAWPYGLDTNKVEVLEDCIRTSCGNYPRIPLSSAEEADERISDLEVGYKVGVVYIPDDEDFAELYYVVNGNVFGPYARGIPYKQSPLFAVADLFGRTKKVRVLPLRFGKELASY